MLPFSVLLQTILIKMGSWVYILMANEVYIAIFTLYFQTVVNILSFFGESSSGTIPENAIWWPFSFAGNANKIISLVISLAENDRFKVVRVGFTKISCVITASLICNRFSM